MKVYVVTEWETGEDAVTHIASTQEKAIEFARTCDKTYWNISVEEVEVDGDFYKRTMVFKGEGLPKNKNI